MTVLHLLLPKLPPLGICWYRHLKRVRFLSGSSCDLGRAAQYTLTIREFPYFISQLRDHKYYDDYRWGKNC